MSEISGLIDELNKSADEWNSNNMFELAHMCREAADTILELRDDLQRANDAVRDAEHDESRAWDRVRSAERRNDKLRELCKLFDEYVSHDRCEGCLCKIRCDYGEIEECWQLTEIREAAHELGMEVHA